MPRTKTTARSPDGSSGDAAGKETVIPESRTEEATTVPEINLMQLPLGELHPFEGHPFKVLDDELMAQTVESIQQVGILNPLIARPDPDGGYEILSGQTASRRAAGRA